MKKLLIMVGAILALASPVSSSAQPMIIDHGSAVAISKVPVPLVLRDKNGNKVSLSDAYGPVLSNNSAPVFMKGTMAVGPLLNSSNYSAFAGSVVSNALNNVKPAGAPSNAPSSYAPLDHRLSPDYIMTPKTGSGVKMWLGQLDPASPAENENGNTVWGTIHVWSEQRFLPTRLTCTWVSSDGNRLGKEEIFSDTNLVYTIASLGVVWGSGGQRVNDTYIQGGKWNQTAVNEFVFTGSASKTMQATNQAQVDSNKAWMMAFDDFELVAIWRLYGENGELLASFAKKIQTKKNAVANSLSIQNLESGLVKVGVNGETNRTGVIESSTSVSGSWEMVTIANHGDRFTFPKDPSMRIFRLNTDP